MASLDHVRLAHALAKTSVQPDVNDDTVEQCIYQIGLMLANDDPDFDLRNWRVLIAKRQASLQQTDKVTKMTPARLENRSGRKTGNRHGKEANRNSRVRRA